MNKQEIEAKVIEIVRFQLCLDESEKITLHTKFDDFRLDSLDMVEISLGVEEEFDIEISDEEYDGIKNIRGIVKIVEVKCG